MTDWIVAHKPNIGGGGCDPTCKASPPHFTDAKPSGVIQNPTPALRAQLDALREKGRITLTDYQKTAPACGVAPLDLTKPEEKLRTIHDLHAKTCEDGECLICGVLSCPLGEPMHYHHDGCPACPTDEDGYGKTGGS